jgi:hypothetical protein
VKAILGLSFLLGLAQAGVVTPQIQVRPSTTNVSIGERFQVTVEANGPSGTRFEFPREVTTGSVELVQSQPTSARAGVVVYDAQIFALGQEASIPEIEIQYKTSDGSTGSVKSAPVPINVVSTLDPNEANPAPADFAPPLPVLVSRAFWIASGAAGLLILAGIVMLVRRLRFPRKPAEASFTPAISPEEEALGGLEKLAAARATLEPRAFYILLVPILKQYLERRLEAPVLEMTSTETVAVVKTHAWTHPHAVALRDLVTTADLVKFGGSSDASNGDRQIQLVRDLVSRIDRLRRAQIDMQAKEEDRRRTA